VSTDSKELYSFIFSASNVFLTTIDEAGAFVWPLDRPGTQDFSAGSSPETLINAHMISTADDGRAAWPHVQSHGGLRRL